MPEARHGSTPITDIRRGSTVITEVRRGSTLVWTRNTLADYFDRDDAATLGTNWADCGSSNDYKIGIENGTARLKLPEGLIGGFFAHRRSSMRFTLGTATADDGFVECRAATRGDPSSWLDGVFHDFDTRLYGRVPNSGSNSGVGISMQHGQCFITGMVNGNATHHGDGGAFQPGDRLRLTYEGNYHRLYVNGTARVSWTDSGNTIPKGAGYRSMLLWTEAGKDFLGPRRFAPALDYVIMA